MKQKVDIESLKKNGFTYEEIQEIIKSEEDFLDTWISRPHDEVKNFARQVLFDNTNQNV